MTSSANCNSSESSLETERMAQAGSVIDMNHVSMIFNMASEQLNSLKEYFIALTKGELRFKELRALDDITFSVQRGDVVGILGSNGSGKSTLLKIIAGVLEPSEGTCRVQGNIAPLIELGAGFDLELTARENIYLNGALLGYSKEFIDVHFDEIVKFAEIENFLDMPMKNYSSGMVARAAFSIATAVVPDILIVDEVLSVGDFMFQQKCERRINLLINEHNVTVLFVSHDTSQIERICKKAIWIENGHLREMGEAATICTAYRLIGARQHDPAAESVIVSALAKDVDFTDGPCFESFASENRFISADRIAQETFTDFSTVILASGKESAASFSAVFLSSILDAPILLASQSGLADRTYNMLKESSFEHVIILGDETLIGSQVNQQLMRVNPRADIKRVSEYQPYRLGNSIFEFALEHGAEKIGKTAILTYEHCVGDLISYSGFMFAERCPAFYCISEHNIDDATFRYLADHFKRILVLGGDGMFSDACLERFACHGIEIVRICGDGPYQANLMINGWLEEEYRRCGIEINRTVLVASFHRPEFSYTLGTFAGKNHMMILLDDPEDITSVSFAIQYLEAHADEIDSILFIGDETLYSYQDKELLEKALKGHVL